MSRLIISTTPSFQTILTYHAGFEGSSLHGTLGEESRKRAHVCRL